MRNDRGRRWLLGAMVALAAALLYSPTLSYDYTYLDDHQLILEQRSFLARPSSMLEVFGRTYFGGAADAYYRPIVNLSFVLDAQWTGTRPFGYHLTNVVLHAATAVLVLAMLLRLGAGEAASLCAALGFVAHPAQVGSVAWIPGRNDVLMSGFALGACLLLLRAGERQGPGAKIGHGICFLAALFSKETALALPLLFLALTWAKHPELRLWRRAWPWLAWSGALSLYLVARFRATSPGFGIGRLALAWQRPVVLVSDFGKLLLPVRQQVLATPEDLPLWPGLIAMAGTVTLMWFLRGLRSRIGGLGALFALVPLLAGLLGAQVVVLESRLYLALVGVSILAGELSRAALASNGRGRLTFIAGAATMLVLFAVAVLAYCPSFRDRERFSRAAIEGSPHSGLAAHLMSRNLGGRLTSADAP